jgi:hypothetical protein
LEIERFEERAEDGALDGLIIFFALNQEHAIWNTLRDLAKDSTANKLRGIPWGRGRFEHLVSSIAQERHFKMRVRALDGEHVSKLTMAALIDEEVFDAVMAYHGTSLEMDAVCTSWGTFQNRRGGGLIENVWDEIAIVVAEQLAEGGLVDLARIAALVEPGRYAQPDNVLAVLDAGTVVESLESTKVEQVRCSLCRGSRFF